MLAYLDAASGSMIVQAIVAGAAGAAVFLKLGWRRITGPYRRRPAAEVGGTAYRSPRHARQGLKQRDVHQLRDCGLVCRQPLAIAGANVDHAIAAGVEFGEIRHSFSMAMVGSARKTWECERLSPRHARSPAQAACAMSCT